MILDDIVAARREDLARDKREVGVEVLVRRPAYAASRRSLTAALRGRRPAIIAEFKKASPSRGPIRPDADPAAIARVYAAAGAAAISVLTEPRFFRGSLDDLLAVRGCVDLPVLRKDFLIDPYQIVEARAWGADAVLLIVAMLDDQLLAELLGAAAAHGLEALVEVHDAAELERALRCGTTLLGINNRDLRTFVTTLETGERLRPHVPAHVTTVAESGIDSADDIARLRAAGFNAFLIGESLMRARDPGAKLRELLMELKARREIGSQKSEARSQKGRF